MIFKYVTYLEFFAFTSNLSATLYFDFSLKLRTGFFSSLGNSVFNQKVSAAQALGILSSGARLLIILQE